MRHVVAAGPEGTKHPATWSSKTGQLSGDPIIVNRAKRMETVTTHAEDGEVPIDWKDAKTAVPALIDAAQWVYGKPVLHVQFPETGGHAQPRPSVSPPSDAA